MDGAETVVHFAAESHVDRSIADSQVFLRTNVLGTHTLLEEAKRRAGQIKRFHHVSTDEVFGALPLDALGAFNEATGYAPRSPYSASKAASDHLVRSYFTTYDLPVSITNCSNNYGPYHYPEKFIPLLIVNALRNRPLPIYGDGKYVRDWIHVDDHCAGIEAALTGGKAGETYCLGGNAERANIDVATLILDHLSLPHTLVQSVRDRKGHDRRYALDFAKAERELGWRPRIGFEDGLRRTIDWYIENQLWWEPLVV
jgi:dTDP-glucose 4,6-dehydratase